ncbi:MAG: penicillin-binding transpeptidase domain-containing protein [Anaerolineae bacterium]
MREVQLPTLVPLPTVTVDLQEPARIATAFLSAWQNQDFATMYSLMAFSAQETISLEDFQTRYEDVQDTMTFESVSFEAMSMASVGSRTAQLSYNVTFQTRLLGEIEDDGRTLTVILDPQTGIWRVAWSAGDIFAEFASGARLEFQSNAPSRSNIYARDGEIVADMQGRMVEVFVVREEPDDWALCRTTLSEVINITPERVDQIYASARSNWSMRVGRIESQTYNEQRARLENDCDATFEGFSVRRYHPNGNVLGHVLGHVGLPDDSQVEGLIQRGFNSETIIGQAGIERSWNDTLMGVPGGRLQIINADGSRARVLAEISSQISESLWLTIDLSLQQFIIDTFNTAYLQNRQNANGDPSWGATSPGAVAVMIDVNTGAILAMVSYPTYDANAFTTYPAIGRQAADEIQAAIAEDPRNPLLNRVTQGEYPVGSTFKVIGAIAVLDTNVYDANTSYFCSGIWRYEGDTRYDWYPPGHGTVNTRTALMQSCNPFFYQAGFVLNNADPYFLPNYSRRLGLGGFTGLTDLPESPGQIPDPDSALQLTGLPWSYANAINLSIGQGEMSVTPLQMVRLYAAIANGGNLMRPYLVEETGILNQRTPVAEPTVVSNFDVSDETLAVVQAGLCDVIGSTAGTAEFVFRNSPLVEVGVCGKTGTAQAPNQDPPFSWFASYAPADDPEVALIVMVENAGEGSAIAAPLSRQILEYYFFLNDE